MSLVVVNHNIKIPIDELDFKFSKSSGPGGQKVNKTNTKALLSWSLVDSQSISDEVKQKLEQKIRLSNDGRITLSSDKYRSQDRNKSDCINKFKALIKNACFEPKKRKKTKPTRSSREKRLKEKKSRSETKKLRKNIY